MKFNFFQMFNSIFTSLSPNTEIDDIVLCFKLFFQPDKWKRGQALIDLENRFKELLKVKHAFTFNSGRSAFLAILKSLNLQLGTEVLIQGFTCNALVNPILWLGLKPVFVDIDEKTLNMDVDDLETKIGPESKVVVVQHTFGFPTDLDRVQEVCQKHNLILIEDCAHSLGASYNNKKLGTFGQAAFFSFGRDKIISSVYGGMAVTNDDTLGQKIQEFQKMSDFPRGAWIFQQLLHPVLTNLIVKPLYGFWGLGRPVLIFLQKSRILSKAVTKKEKKGEKPEYIGQRMPNALAILALHQLEKLDYFLDHQKKIVSIYDKNLKRFSLPIKIKGRIYMRYPLLLEKPDKLLRQLRKHNMFLDDGWRRKVIVPPDTNQDKMGYTKGSCPKAEWVAERILNLPTHINISSHQAKKIVEFLNKYGVQRD
jgi:dTDP-4-amino-4,6-dideoxygalactose transaminase